MLATCHSSGGHQLRAQEFDVVIIDEATQALEAVIHIFITTTDFPYLVCRFAGYLYSRQRNSSLRATQNSFLQQSIHCLHQRILGVKGAQNRVWVLILSYREPQVISHSQKVSTPSAIVITNWTLERLVLRLRLMSTGPHQGWSRICAACSRLHERWR